MDWAQVAQDRDKWQILENMVRGLWVPSNAGNFFISWETIAPQGLCPISCLTQNYINTYFCFTKLKLLLVNARTFVVWKWHTMYFLQLLSVYTQVERGKLCTGNPYVSYIIICMLLLHVLSWCFCVAWYYSPMTLWKLPDLSCSIIKFSFRIIKISN